MKMVSRFVALVSAAMVLTALVPNSASATTIPVVNPSFEDPAGPFGSSCGAECTFRVGSIPGWSNGGDSGQIQLNTAVNSSEFNYVADETQYAWIGGTAGPISQTVSALALAGTTYTLQVDVGFRKDIFQNSTVTLIVGSNTILAIGIPQEFSGNWSNYTASYTATGLDASQPISISLAVGPATAQSDFDNVRLDATVTPLPSTWLMLLSGFVGLGYFAYRGTKNKAAANAAA